MKTQFITLVLLCSLFIGFKTHAQVHVYSYPDTLVTSPHFGVNYKSPFYSVTIKQGTDVKSAYVMFDKNHETGNLAALPNNNWTNFSFDGNVTIEIERLDGVDISYCDVFPKKKGFTASISGKKATIEVSKQTDPLQLYVQMNGLDKNPLFIFCDPLETDVPDRNDSLNTEIIYTTDTIETVHAKLKSSKKYVVFEEGIHKWKHSVQYVAGGNQPKNLLVTEGYKMPLVSNKKIYIPGGAYVIGSFDNGTTACNNTKIYGRGILSACGLQVIAGTTGIPYSMVHISSGTKDTVQGIISTNPPHFHLTVRPSYSYIDNVKMFAWWYSTDGTVTGDNSKVVNCFFKLNDDAIKLYAQRCYHRNNTMYHQINGAPFQFSWGNQQGDFNEVYDTYIVHSMNRGAGCKGDMNSGIINSRTGAAANVWEANNFNGLYIDNGCQYFIALNANGGTFKNMLIQNVELNSGYKTKPQEACSYFQKGTFQNINIMCMKIDGRAILKTGTTDSGDMLKYSTFGTVTGAPAFVACETIPTNSNNSIKDNLKVYPTRFSDILYFEGISESAYYQLIDVSGKVVSNGKLLPAMNFSNLNPGLYFCRIYDDNNIQTVLKVMKE